MTETARFCYWSNTFKSERLNNILFIFFRIYKTKLIHQLLLLCYARYLENSCGFADVLTQQIPLHPFFKVSWCLVAASPYLTWAAEGFELTPACLILQLVREPQTGSSGSIACILLTCLGTLALPQIHRWGGWGRNAPAKKASTPHWLFHVEAEWLKITSGVVLLAGRCPPACATPAQPACAHQESHTQPAWHRVPLPRPCWSLQALLY